MNDRLALAACFGLTLVTTHAHAQHPPSITPAGDMAVLRISLDELDQLIDQEPKK